MSAGGPRFIPRLPGMPQSCRARVGCGCRASR